MANPLLSLWSQLLRRDRSRASVAGRRIAAASSAEASEAIFLIMRRMRAPLILLIVIFAVTVLGLTLIPGQDGAGRPWRMGFFDAFYVMSYTATTIGFGEIPYPFTYGQRMWVTISIYLTVIGWAYAIGTLLYLVRTRSFRHALALQHFRRKVNRLREPFLLIAGYGRTGELVGQSFDALGGRIVIVDSDEDRVDDVEPASYLADVPALAVDARDPGHLSVAGLAHPWCEAVVALAGDEEVNLAVVMSAALLRPDLPVVARTTSSGLADRMRAFANLSVVNPFDSFGDHVRIAVRSPASYQLMSWLEEGPGAELPSRGAPPNDGGWVVCGYGRLGRRITAELAGDGIPVTAIDPEVDDDAPGVVVADGTSPGVLARAGLESAVGFVAGTDNDTTNLSLVAAARQANPTIFVAARQNRAENAPLFEAMTVDALLVPSEVIAREVYAQLSTPLLWRFLKEMPAQGDDWAAQLVDRLVDTCGPRLQVLWKVRLTSHEAPALVGGLRSGQVRLGDLLRDPDDRDERLPAAVLIARRDVEYPLAPDDDFRLALDDELLLVGSSMARRALGSVLLVDAVREYVLTGRRVPESWIWRRLSRRLVT